jgi:hypothetical protein
MWSGLSKQGHVKVSGLEVPIQLLSVGSAQAGFAKNNSPIFETESAVGDTKLSVRTL